MPAYETEPIERLRTTTFFAVHARMTGIPAIAESGSSSASELTVSDAPITRTVKGGRKAVVSGVSGERRAVVVVLLLTEVRLGQVIVDLIHLEDDIIRHSSLREEHIQLAGHAAGDRMDRKADSAAVRFQLVDDVGDGILSAGDGEAVSRNDNNALRLCHAGG